MATGAIIGGVLALGGLGLQIGGAIGQASDDAQAAADAEAFAQLQYEATTGDLTSSYALAIEQGKENADFARETQRDNYAAVLKNARGTARLKTESVDQQEAGQTQAVSLQGTQAAARRGATQGLSGASGSSSSIVKRQQQSLLARGITGIGEQADLAREGIDLSLEQTEEGATRSLQQSLQQIDLQEDQFQESAQAQLNRDLRQANLNRISTTYGIPTSGEIGGAAALDILSSGLNFGSELLDLFD